MAPKAPALAWIAVLHSFDATSRPILSVLGNSDSWDKVGSAVSQNQAASPLKLDASQHLMHGCHAAMSVRLDCCRGVSAHMTSGNSPCLPAA
jgi:hypothetical protein